MNRRKSYEGPPTHPIPTELPVFSRRLTYLLNNRGRGSRADLSRKTGITPNAIANYQRGKHIPLLSVALAIAEEFGVTIDWLCGKDESQEGQQ